MSQQQLISLTDLVEDIALAVLQSSFIIKEISLNMKQVFYKDAQFDPVTSADYLVQMTMTRLLFQKYPGLKIVGQEDLQSDEDFSKKILEASGNIAFLNQAPLQKFDSFPFSKSLQKSAHLSQKFQASSLCLWIDPLDCTRGFVNNRQEEVTILVGITHQNRPIAGIIGQPFKINQKSKKCEFNPSVIFGSNLLNKINEMTDTSTKDKINCQDKNECFEYTLNTKTWKTWSQFNETQDSLIQKKAAVSSRRIPLKQEYLMSNLQLEQLSSGGAGNKVLKVVRKEASMVMFIDAKTSKWDSCAGEAVIHAMGGLSIKPNLQNIDYDPFLAYGNQEGWIFCLDPKMFQKVKETLIELKEKQQAKNLEVLQEKKQLII